MLGFGAVFALLAVFLVWVDVKFSGVIYNSEQAGALATCSSRVSWYCLPSWLSLRRLFGIQVRVGNALHVFRLASFTAAVPLGWLNKSDCPAAQFNTAGRSIGCGLLAVDLVSHWCESPKYSTLAL